MESLTPELRKQLNVKAEAGAVVMEVLPNTPAAQAGLKRDDVITQVNGQAVKDPGDLRAAVQKAGAGKDVTLHLLRGSNEKEIKVALKTGPGIGGIFPDFPDVGVPALDIGGQAKIRELERRIQELEQRLNALEKQRK